MHEAIKYLAAGALTYGVVAACGGSSSDVREANAQAPAEAACGRCTFPPSVTIKNADSDPAQWVGGTASANAFEPNTELAVGPFYLTDARAVDGQMRLYLVNATDVCNDTLPSAQPLWHLFENTVNTSQLLRGEPAHGARFLVNANQKLCVRDLSGSGNSTTMAWAGFRPYT